MNNLMEVPNTIKSTELVEIINTFRKEEGNNTGLQHKHFMEKIRKEIPNVAITTDFIVGFPGETEEDFLDTLDVVKQVRYASAYTFLYSKRSGTPAAEMKDQVPDDVAKDRFNRLLKEVQAISAELTNEEEGSIQEVLVEEINEQDNSLVTGRLSNNLLVHFKGDKSLVGQLLNVKLAECKGFYYIGELV